MERIERYVQGKMSTEEKQHFELEMGSDARLQDEVKRMKLIDSALEISIEDDLRAQLKKFEAGHSTRESRIPDVKVRYLFSRLAVAAGMLLLISAGLWYMLQGRTSEIDQFVEQQYLDYDYNQLRGEFSRNNFPFRLSDKSFDKQEAAQWLIKWLEENPSDDEARFMLADIMKDMGHIEQAQEQLIKIINQNSIRWGEKAEWNYVLLSAREHWNDKAAATLQSIISDPAHSYHMRAKELAAMQKK